MSDKKILRVENLNIRYHTRKGKVSAVNDVTFDIKSGEFVGLSGESGCGKTTVANSLLRLLPKEGKVESGNIIFNGDNILNYSNDKVREYRWKDVSMIFQGSMNSLNPVHKVIKQMTETIMLHEKISKNEATERSLDLMEAMGLERSRGSAYPHELSGGMRQRVMIALALACQPSLVLADEPTTALDVMVQAQILDLLNDLREKYSLSLLLITHDLSVIAETCDRAIIMYGGRIMEEGPVDKMFTDPAHPYTKKLISSFPSVAEDKEIDYIPGNPPDLLYPPPGCPFKARCEYAIEKCGEDIPSLEPKNEVKVACIRSDEI
ncbi:MAG: ABC transporter ATP-binding protein [Candidatus Hodarchaeales archaeon]